MQLFSCESGVRLKVLLKLLLEKDCQVSVNVLQLLMLLLFSFMLELRGSSRAR